MKELYERILHYAKAIGNLPDNAKLSEVCDFGDAYGFLLDTGDKYANLHWCISKDGRTLSTFRPNFDISRFARRTLLPLSSVE